MDETLFQILTALYQAHADVATLRQQVGELQAQLQAAMPKPPEDDPCS